MLDEHLQSHTYSCLELLARYFQYSEELEVLQGLGVAQLSGHVSESLALMEHIGWTSLRGYADLTHWDMCNIQALRDAWVEVQRVATYGVRRETSQSSFPVPFPDQAPGNLSYTRASPFSSCTTGNRRAYSPCRGESEKCAQLTRSVVYGITCLELCAIEPYSTICHRHLAIALLWFSVFFSLTREVSSFVMASSSFSFTRIATLSFVSQ